MSYCKQITFDHEIRASVFLLEFSLLLTLDVVEPIKAYINSVCGGWRSQNYKAEQPQVQSKLTDISPQVSAYKAAQPYNFGISGRI